LAVAQSARHDKVNRSRSEQQVRARAMREQGYEWGEIGRALAEDYTIVGLQAMRLAHGWSQADAADAWNERWPDLEYPKTRKWISERERWPVSGREPHLHDLVKFSHLYKCRLADLLIGIDEDLRAYVLEGMARQPWESGDGRDAVALADAAMHEAHRFGTDRLASLLTMDAALGHAVAGDRLASDAAFVAAERLYEAHDPDRDPSWLVYYSPASVQSGLAVAHLCLGDPHAAETYTRNALAQRVGDQLPRFHANSSSWLARELVAQGSIDAGAAAVGDTVRLLDGIDSLRIANRLTSLAPIFKANAAVEGVPEAVEALRQLQLSRA
jgi:hypothetical protein